MYLYEIFIKYFVRKGGLYFKTSVEGTSTGFSDELMLGSSG